MHDRLFPLRFKKTPKTCWIYFCHVLFLKVVALRLLTSNFMVLKYIYFEETNSFQSPCTPSVYEGIGVVIIIIFNNIFYENSMKFHSFYYEESSVLRANWYLLKR